MSGDAIVPGPVEFSNSKNVLELSSKCENAPNISTRKIHSPVAVCICCIY